MDLQEIFRQSGFWLTTRVCLGPRQIIFAALSRPLARLCWGNARVAKILLLFGGGYTGVAAEVIGKNRRRHEAVISET